MLKNMVSTFVFQVKNGTLCFDDLRELLLGSALAGESDMWIGHKSSLLPMLPKVHFNDEKSNVPGLKSCWLTS